MHHDEVAATAGGYATNLHEIGQQIAPAFDAEAIHRFRVETKRLRAFIRLVVTEDETLDVKLGKRFKEMYAALGEIRDAQMHLVRVVKEPPPPLPQYALWLAARIGEGQRRWVAAYDEKVTMKLRRRLADTAWPDLKSESLHRFVTEHIAGIQETLLIPALSDDDLHDIRKRIKDLQHIPRWAEKSWPEGMAALEGMPLQGIERLADRAGEYNDERNALDTLEVFIREKQNSSDAEAEVVQRWTQNRDKNRTALVTAIDALRTSGENSDNARQPSD